MIFIWCICFDFYATWYDFLESKHGNHQKENLENLLLYFLKNTHFLYFNQISFIFSLKPFEEKYVSGLSLNIFLHPKIIMSWELHVRVTCYMCGKYVNVEIRLYMILAYCELGHFNNDILTDINNPYLSQTPVFGMKTSTLKLGVITTKVPPPYVLQSWLVACFEVT